MEHIGIDVHKNQSQVCILTADSELVEKRIRTDRDRFAAVLGSRPRARDSHRSLDGERVGGTVPRGPGPRGNRRRSQLRADVRPPQPTGQDGPTRRASIGGSVSHQSVPEGSPSCG